MFLNFTLPMQENSGDMGRKIAGLMNVFSYHSLKKEYDG